MYSGNNLFVNNLTEALEKLMLWGKTGNDLVVALMKSVNSVRIDYGTPNTTDIGENNITWSPDSKTGGMNSLGVESRPAFIRLGHEMAHILDAWNGTIDNSVWVTAGKQVISNAEKYATHIENLLRSENGIPLRTHYAIDISTGVRIGLESTRIIQGRTSLFYQQQNGVSANGIPLLQTAFFYNL